MDRAQALFNAGGAISVQCLNEFASVASRKLGMSWAHVDEALEMIASVCRPIVALDLDLHRRGVGIAQRRQLSVYDAMIVAAALQSGCDTLYSEDMHHGLIVEGRLTIRNPFLDSPAGNS